MTIADGKKRDIFLIGNIGYDLYRTGERLIARPGGSVYNMATAFHCFGQPATVVTHETAAFHPQYLSRLKTGGIQFRVRKPRDKRDNLFLFEFDKAGPTDANVANAFYEVTHDALPVDLISPEEIQTHPIHVGTMPLFKSANILNQIRPRFASMNLYLAYLKSEEELREQIRLCLPYVKLLFLNREELRIIRKAGLLEEIQHQRTVVLTSGHKGAMGFYDGKCVAHYSPLPVAQVCSIGAGDIFSGAVLAQLHSGAHLENALPPACELAKLSVLDYGVEHLNPGSLRSLQFQPVKELSYARLEDVSDES